MLAAFFDAIIGIGTEADHLKPQYIPDDDPDLESPFYILKNTLCPSVLTENLFMDNQEDYKFLLSAAGKRAIVGLHVRAFCEYLKMFN